MPRTLVNNALNASNGGGSAAAGVPTLAVSSVSPSHASVTVTWIKVFASRVQVRYQLGPGPVVDAGFTTDDAVTLTGLQPLSSYTVVLTPYLGDSKGDARTVTVTTRGAPTVTSLALVPSHDSVTATWQGANASSIRVQYRVGTGQLTVWKDLAGDAQSTTITALAAGVAHYVRVTPMGGDGVSGSPVDGTATTLATPIPVLSGLTVEPSTATILATWSTANADVVSVQYKRQADIGWTPAGDHVFPFALLTDLAASTKYFVRATPRRKDGVSGLYLQADTTTRADLPSVTPTFLALDTYVNVSWVATNAFQVAVSYGTHVESLTLLGTYDTTVTSAVVTGLAPSAAYYIKASARRSDDTDSISTVTPITTTGLTSIASSGVATVLDMYADVWWEAPHAHSVRVEHVLNGMTTLVNTLIGTSTRISNLSPSTTYSVKLTPLRLDGTFGPHASFDVTTLPPPSVTPSLGTYTDVSIPVSWTSNVPKVRVRYKPAASAQWTTAGEFPNPATLAATIASLAPDTSYVIEFTPVRSDETLGQASTLAATTFKTPTASISHTQPTHNSIYISCEASWAARVRIEYRQATQTEFSTWKILDGPGPSGTASVVSEFITGLVPNTAYVIRVVPIRTDGSYAAASAPVTTTTLVAPQVSFKSLLPTATSLVVEWTSLNAQNVRIQYAQGPVGAYTTFGTFAASLTNVEITGLTAGTAYTVKLAPVAPNGDEGDATTLAMETLPMPAMSVSLGSTIPNVDDTGATSLTAVLNPAIMNDAVRGYVVDCRNGYIDTSYAIRGPSYTKWAWFYLVSPLTDISGANVHADILSNSYTGLSTKHHRVFVSHDASTQYLNASTKTSSSGTINAICPVGEWVHVAYVYDGANHTVTLYVNGVQVATDAANPQLGTTEVLATVAIGAYQNTYFFNGFLDNLRVYETALTPARVLATYQAERMFTPSLPSTAFVPSPGSIQATWTLDHAAAVRVEHGLSLGTLSVDTTTADSTFTLAGLAPGTYTVRLTPIRRDGSPGPAGSVVTQQVTVP